MNTSKRETAAGRQARFDEEHQIIARAAKRAGEKSLRNTLLQEPTVSLVKKLRTVEHPLPWAGPSGEGSSGGVTQSMLGRYLCCKERFRILVIEGLKPRPRFSAPMDFGNLWHSCEEALASGNDYTTGLENTLNKMLAQYPRDVENVLHWGSVAQELFPVYADYWSEHPDVRNRTPLLSEQVFDVSYTLPSGRVVRLRGKWDSEDLVNDGKTCDLWLQENKTKSSIDRPKIMRQLTFDLQTMLYLIALGQDTGIEALEKVKEALGTRETRGVRYNVVRRSAHKTAASMMKKVKEDMDCGRSNEWFDRFNVHVSAQDIKKFKQECLDPVLENLLDDYEWWADCKSETDAGVGWSPAILWNGERRHLRFSHHLPRHFRFPFGVYHSVLEGGFGDVDAYMEDGSEAGLQRVTNLFPELQDTEEPN